MVDKCYQEMIDVITGNASDREQLQIIESLVLSLRDWQDPYEEGSIEEIYYQNMDRILYIIDETLKKEDEMNEKSNI
jgi:hypothetical protein